MTISKYLWLLALAACSVTACHAQAKREPHIGYLYPGGGQQGTTFEVAVGGQFLRSTTNVYTSGKGVHASVIQHYSLRRRLNGEQSKELQRQLRELMAKHADELPIKARVFFKRMGIRGGAKKEEAAEMQAVELPEHPLLRDLESKSLRELHHVANELLKFSTFLKKQLNTQLGEMLLVKVTIDPDATPGDRELWLESPLGLTNPMCFQVGTLPEMREIEVNDPESLPYLPKEPPINLPVVLNGQIMPGDVDRFRFRAKRGQQLVIETHARHLVPYLADAVPGWFQATVALYDGQGREVAFADDYRFLPDPVLFYEIPEDGEYELEIRDSIYRGREDFVYRIAVGELPFITQMFPLGGQAGVTTVAAIDGWHLPNKQLPLDTQPGDNCIRQTALRQDGRVSNEVVYAVDTLPECNETEPNDDAKNAQRIVLPRIVNGRIGQPGDVDVFQFEGHAGDEVVAEVLARRLHSPLDSLLRVTDSSGSVLGWNDDYVRKDGHLHKDMGFLTHHADSYLIVRLPKDGIYYVRLADAQNHGGEAHGYRLRISRPRPDFALRMTPSRLSILAGRVVPVTVHALRKDGFEGDIELVLKNAPAGFALSGGRIFSGRDRVRMTLTAPQEPSDRPIPLQLAGRAQIDGETVTRPVVPSEDVMQAFLYRHLAPSQELMVAVRKVKWRLPDIELAGGSPLQIPAGGTAEVRVKAPLRLKWRLEIELSEPPEGVTLQDVRVVPDGLALQLKAEGGGAETVLADNLITELFIELAGRKKDKKSDNAATQKKRVSLGILPAIPFVVVQP